VGLIASGSSIGGLVGALLGIFTFDLYGWRPVFIGSSFLIFLFPLYLRWLPEGTGFLVRNGRADELRRYMRLARPNEILADEVEIVTAPGKNKVPVGEVFSDGRTRGVLLFWVCYLCNLFVIHGFNSWLPKLMVNRGFKLEQGLSFLLPVSIASIVMTFLIGRITDRVGAKPVLVVLYLLSSSAIFLVGMSHDYVVLMFLCGLAGVGFNGAQNMMNGYSPTYFPPPIRSTATGYNFVLGRFGGVAGPLVVGLLISAAWSFNDTMIALAIPSVIAAVAIASIPEKFGFAARKKHAEVAAVA
jgi:AAHS family benzoate transporter-like MFS transporter